MQGLKNMPKYWGSTKEMSEYLGVSRDTLLNLDQRENMPTSVVGRGWRVKTSAVDE